MNITAPAAARSSRPQPSPRRRFAARTILATGLLVVGLGASMALSGSAGAQTVPTTPCEGCGGGPPGDGTLPWSYTEFVCSPQRAFLIQFGVGRNVGEPVTFSAGTGPLSQAVTPVSIVEVSVPPGGHGSVLLPEPPQGIVKVRIVGVGARTGRVLLDNTRELACECGESATTTTTPITPTSSPAPTPPTVVPTSTPAGSTVPSATTEPEASATTVARLPETGSSPLAAGLGATLVAAGLVALVLVARGRPGDEAA